MGIDAIWPLANLQQRLVKTGGQLMHCHCGHRAEQISMTMLGAGGSVENSVGEAAVSGINVNARRNRSVAVRWKGHRAQNPARPLRLQIKQSWCESEIRI